MNENENDPVWQRIRGELRRRVPEPTYEIWLAPLTYGGFTGGTVVIGTPEESHGWIDARLRPVIADAVAAALEQRGPVSMELRVAGRNPTPARATGSKAPAASREPVGPHEESVGRRLHPKYTFDQFVIGSANRFAHAAALAAAELPGIAYNPLFLVGPPGVGKTHLLHSIGNYVAAFGGGLEVRYTTAEDFTNGFRKALEARSIDSFKRRFRGADVLLIDDVQFLAGKERTGEEFFHTFNTLREAGSQLVLTADRPPSEMRGLEERLSQRFESGLLVTIDRPDATMRTTIVRKRAALDGLELTDDVIELIAARVTDTVRGIEAALIRIAAYSSLTGEPIDPATVTHVLDQLHGRAQARRPQPLSIEAIQEAVAASFGLTRDELLSGSRVARIAWPRQLAMYIAREHSGASLPAIGGAFGGRDHSTVIHACRRAAARIADDPETTALCARLVEDLHSPRPQ